MDCSVYYSHCVSIKDPPQVIYCKILFLWKVLSQHALITAGRYQQDLVPFQKNQANRPLQITAYLLQKILVPSISGKMLLHSQENAGSVVLGLPDNSVEIPAIN